MTLIHWNLQVYKYLNKISGADSVFKARFIIWVRTRSLVKRVIIAALFAGATGMHFTFILYVSLAHQTKLNQISNSTAQIIFFVLRRTCKSSLKAA